MNYKDYIEINSKVRFASLVLEAREFLFTMSLAGSRVECQSKRFLLIFQN